MKFNKTISLFGEISENRGPGKIMFNLILGLERMGIKYHIEEKKEGDYNYLAGSSSSSFSKVSPSSGTTLLGPCIESHFGTTHFHRQYSHFICAGDWHARFHKEWNPEKTKDKTIDVWPIGVDTKLFKSSKKKKKYDCLFHYKHGRSFGGWEIFKKIVKKFNLKTDPDKKKHLVDGTYTTEQLVERCNSCKFIITISGSETQGIGKMEIMATNTPMFVLDSNCHWAFGSIWSPFPTSSVPHWSDECGVVLHEKDYTKEYLEVLDPCWLKCGSENVGKSNKRLTSYRRQKRPQSELTLPEQGRTLKIRYIYKHFDYFINNLTKYSPRRYILREHTLEKSIKNLIKIFKKYE